MSFKKVISNDIISRACFDQFFKSMLNTQNEFRALHSQDEAYQIPELRVNEMLVKEAQEYADMQIFMPSEKTDLGENLAIVWSYSPFNLTNNNCKCIQLI